MPNNKSSANSVSHRSVRALIAAAAFAITSVSVAHADSAELRTPTDKPVLREDAVTDISAARRRHIVHRRGSDPTKAYGALAPDVAPAAPAYGYGQGDNSRNVTW